MYKVVNCTSQLELFNNIKQCCWQEKGFEMERNQHSDKFLLIANNGEVGGTVEFTPSTYMSNFTRDIFKDVITEDMKVLEIDGYAVLPKYRGVLGMSGIRLAVQYAEKYKYTHAVALCDPKVFHYIHKVYKCDIKQVSDMFFYKGADVIPAIMDAIVVYENKHTFKWWKEMTEIKDVVSV
ncbi:GNAT family N-acetyltransferase [Cytobacillus sp. IB215665]|uniref:GNAT family N-acetyltransferase n=1 Tax=Cytobacillus sp. IB215665 TaxID=3097357 RepID=UPI002A0DF9C8|nr:GNAT family N-acetyltransferase [Cytobacillus sp. IB215665]MDX8365296.1 N-acetyltransferase [Cytobacillus sp. IB215665]